MISGTLSISCTARGPQTVHLALVAGLSCYEHCWSGRRRESLGYLDSRLCSNCTHVCNRIISKQDRKA